MIGVVPCGAPACELGSRTRTIVKVDDNDRLGSWLRVAYCPNGSDALTDPRRTDNLRCGWDIVASSCRVERVHRSLSLVLVKLFINGGTRGRCGARRLMIIQCIWLIIVTLSHTSDDAGNARLYKRPAKTVFQTTVE